MWEISHIRLIMYDELDLKNIIKKVQIRIKSHHAFTPSSWRVQTWQFSDQDQQVVLSRWVELKSAILRAGS